MRLSFDTIDEVKDFVKQLKGTRGGKAGDADEGSTQAGNAPTPLAPPNNPAPFNPAAGGPAFAPPAGGAGPTGAGPFAAGAPTVAPDVQAIVAKIGTAIDGFKTTGRWNEQALTWFRQQCGPDAAQATEEQIRSVFLPKLQMPQLTQIAGYMGVQA